MRTNIVNSFMPSYAFYYNKKYGRVGHLFQDRFRSEPCNDAAYFITLFRYIHQKEKQKDIVRDVMLKLNAGPRQLSRVSGLPYSIIYKLKKL